MILRDGRETETAKQCLFFALLLRILGDFKGYGAERKLLELHRRLNDAIEESFVSRLKKLVSHPQKTETIHPLPRRPRR